MSIELDKYLEGSWVSKKNANGDIKVTVLAAGLGKRMEPLTGWHLPKPMFPLGGNVPMAELWVKKAVDSGITDISMNLCVLKDRIKHYFQDGAKYGVSLNYIEEDQPTGTLGGVCKQALGNKAKQVLKNEIASTVREFKGSTILAPSGDIVTNFSAEELERMYEIHKQKGAAFTMLLTPVPWERRAEFGTVALDRVEHLSGNISQSGKIVDFREKDPASPSNLNNASIYMIEMELLKRLDDLRTEAGLSQDTPFYDFGKHVFPALLGKLPELNLPKDFLVWGIQYDGLWFDVGRKRDYLTVNQAFLDGKIHLETAYEKLVWGYLGNNVKVDFSEITIRPPVVIGHNCEIEPGAILGPYAIIGDGWHIERGAAIANSVLWGPCGVSDNEARSQNNGRLQYQNRVNRGVDIEHCIIAGGVIENDLQEQTVYIAEDGKTTHVSIDWVPDVTRA